MKKSTSVYSKSEDYKRFKSSVSLQRVRIYIATQIIIINFKTANLDFVLIINLENYFEKSKLSYKLIMLIRFVSIHLLIRNGFTMILDPKKMFL